MASMYSSMSSAVPASTAQIFDENIYGDSVVPNMIGMPRRAEEFQQVFQNPISVNAQQGEWMSRFDPAQGMQSMAPRSLLGVPATVVAPQMAARDVMADYAHGLPRTLLISEPKWNVNTTLMGQPEVPVRPMDLCPIDLSSHYAMGKLNFE